MRTDAGVCSWVAMAAGALFRASTTNYDDRLHVGCMAWRTHTHTVGDIRNQYVSQAARPLLVSIILVVDFLVLGLINDMVAS